MSTDQTPPVVQDNKLGNRKNRRMLAALARRKNLKGRRTVKQAVLGMIKEMQQSERVQELVVSGKLDEYLK